VTRYDPIPDLMRLGYTWRESAFLYLVGANSGFFLVRQYCDFVNRKLGAIAQRFTDKGIATGHFRALGYGQGRHIYHLHSRTLYRIFGNEESPFRHPKGDHEIKTRLMVLDYVLSNREEPCLTLEQEKIEFFLRQLRVTRDVLPTVAFNTGSSSVRHFPDRFPIYFRTTTTGLTELRFPYFDIGTSTIKPFRRFLERHTSLLEELGTFEMIYVAESPRNFLAAERVFDQLFPKTSKLLPFGREHIINFFRAQSLWDSKSPKFSQQDLAVLKEGERVYSLPEHCELLSAWRKSRTEFDAGLARLGGKQVVQGTFSTHILQRTYPLFTHRYQGRGAEKASKSPFRAISNFDSIAS